MNGTELIAAERHRQINEENWTPEHDVGYADGELAVAAVCYAVPRSTKTRPALLTYNQHPGWCPDEWPWDPSWFKLTPGDRVRDLVKAGALIAAEIDRLTAVD